MNQWQRSIFTIIVFQLCLRLLVLSVSSDKSISLVGIYGIWCSCECIGMGQKRTWSLFIKDLYCFLFLSPFKKGMRPSFLWAGNFDFWVPRSLTVWQCDQTSCQEVPNIQSNQLVVASKKKKKRSLKGFVSSFQEFEIVWIICLIGQTIAQFSESCVLFF